MTRRTFFLFGLALELILVFGLFVPYVWIVRAGETVLLRTVPIDPRSIFRGDFVMLDYEVGRGLPAAWDFGTPVYVVLEAKGEFFEHVRFEKDMPILSTGQACLRGMAAYQQVSFPDIAQYFVTEGEGRELEEARNARRLFVELAVTKGCQAVIKGMRLGPEVPPEEVTEDVSREFPRVVPRRPPLEPTPF